MKLTWHRWRVTEHSPCGHESTNTAIVFHVWEAGGAYVATFVVPNEKCHWISSPHRTMQAAMESCQRLSDKILRDRNDA